MRWNCVSDEKRERERGRGRDDKAVTPRGMHAAQVHGEESISWGATAAQPLHSLVSYNACKRTLLMLLSGRSACRTLGKGSELRAVILWEGMRRMRSVDRVSVFLR